MKRLETFLRGTRAAGGWLGLGFSEEGAEYGDALLVEDVISGCGSNCDTREA